MRHQFDEAALSFDAFFGQSKQQLVAMAYLLTGEMQSAQDLAQEALLRAWSRWARVGSYEDPLGWTRRVLYNLAVSDARREKYRRRPVDGPAHSPGPDEAHLVLAAALRALPEEQMRALVLHDGAGMSVRDVAAEMRVPEGTVKSWLSRGRTAAATSLRASSAKESHVEQ